VWRRRRRKPFRFQCPFCGNVFFWAHAGLVRERYDTFPVITSLRGDLKCTDCGLVTEYDDFVKLHRGWPL
jgi:transcription elongation factor Elf1